jgi:hypothetical protein
MILTLKHLPQCDSVYYRFDKFNGMTVYYKFDGSHISRAFMIGKHDSDLHILYASPLIEFSVDDYLD